MDNTIVEQCRKQESFHPPRTHDGLDQDGSSTSGKKWLGAGYVLETTGFAIEMDSGM